MPGSSVSVEYFQVYSRDPDYGYSRNAGHGQAHTMPPDANPPWEFETWQLVTFPVHVPAASSRPGRFGAKETVSCICLGFESICWLGGQQLARRGKPPSQGRPEKTCSCPLEAAAFMALTRGHCACMICLHQSVGGKPANDFSQLYQNQLTCCYTEIAAWRQAISRLPQEPFY